LDRSEDSQEEDSAIPLRYPLIFDHRRYVPRLLWKMGEYQALLRLHLHTKNDVTPLIDIPEIGYDFETQEAAKTIDEHLATFGQRLADKWSERWAFVDLRLIPQSERMSDGRHPVKFIFDTVRSSGALAVPVTGLSRSAEYQEAVRQTAAVDKSGACVRLEVEEMASSTFNARLRAALDNLALSARDCHLILDLGAPNFEPLDGFTKMVRALIDKLPFLNEWNSFTICGTSFPQTMGQLKIGVQIIKRFEWLFYKKLCSALPHGLRKPSFGDYAIAHPKHETKDPRLLKPSASLRYAVDDAWYIAKGVNVRDHGTDQYKNLCLELMRSGRFRNNGFSDAGDYIRKCALGRVKPGGLPRWRQVGTNQHLEKIVFDLSTLNDS